jgi:transposase
MKRPHLSDDVRERAVAAVEAGQSVADVATFCHNDPSTIRRWVRQYRQTGSIKTRPRSGRPPVIKPEQDGALRAQVVAHPDATLAMHCVWWEASHGVRPCLSTMSRRLRALGLTLKKRPSSPASRMPRRGRTGVR